jgi:hypothetical protein
MGNFLVGTFFGIVVSTIGFQGVAHLLDVGVEKTKVVVQKIEKDIK